MDLSIVRHTFTNKSTIGSLYVDHNWFCWTLEDVVRDLKADGSGKVPKETAIGYGRFKVVIDKSQRFNRLMPHILDVPFFEGIRIHWGSYAVNTEGCPLLGFKRTEDMITESRIAFDAFFLRLVEGLQHDQEVWIEIVADGAIGAPSKV